MNIYKNSLKQVTDAMLTMKNNGIEEKFPISLIDIDCWEWPQGVGQIGRASCRERVLLLV